LEIDESDISNIQRLIESPGTKEEQGEAQPLGQGGLDDELKK